MTGMDDTPPPHPGPGQLALDGPAGDLDARGHQLRAELDRLDLAKIAAREEALNAVRDRAILQRATAAELDAAVAEARGYGATWQHIADAVGITRQSAWDRWHR